MNCLCARCAKEIKGKAVTLVPPTFAIELGVRITHFHPSCHTKQERDDAYKAERLAESNAASAAFVKHIR
jgi:hypothetical protein